MRWLIALVGVAGAAGFAEAAIEVPMRLVNPAGEVAEIGVVRVEESAHGIVLVPDLTGLPPGLHGFHVHEHPDCGPAEGGDGPPMAAGAAGGHLDPEETGRHGPPWGEGHLGDLPALYVDSGGEARHPVLAPRLRLDQLRGRSLMIHEGGDNYADEPEPLGGGGARIACGVIR